MTATRNVLGPLTTVFTPNPTCSVPIVNCGGTTECVAWAAQTCNLFSTSYGAMDQSSCWPPYTSGASTVDVSTAGGLYGWGFYSPGLSCPAGYTSACSTTQGGTGDFQFQFPLTNSETAVGCCPSSYSCGGAAFQTCVHTVTSTTYAGLECSGSIDNSLSNYVVPITVTATLTDGISLETISSQVLHAPLIQLNWQASDRLASATSSASGSSMTAALSSNTAGSSSTTTAVGAPAGLSGGAKAGIGIGASFGGLILIATLVWYLLHRRYKSTRRAAANEEMMPSMPSPAGQTLSEKNVNQLYDNSGNQLYDHSGNLPYEKSGTQLYEKSGNQLYEVPGPDHASAWEMPG